MINEIFDVTYFVIHITFKKKLIFVINWLNIFISANDFLERAFWLCRSQDASELPKLLEEFRNTTIPSYQHLKIITYWWVKYSPVSKFNRRWTHLDGDEEVILGDLHWYFYKDVPKSQSNEWTFLYGDDLSLNGDLTKKQFELRKLVINVRIAKRRFLLQKTSFREENPITIDPDCTATLESILSEMDRAEECKSRVRYHMSEFFKPSIIDENSSQLFKRLLEWSLQYHGIEESILYLAYINCNVTSPVFFLKSLLPIFSQKVSQHHFKECLSQLAVRAVSNRYIDTLRLLLELELDPNSCDEDGECLIILAYQYNFMVGVKLLKKFGARNPSSDEISMCILNNDYKLAQVNKILYSKDTTAPISLQHLCIGSVRRLPNFEDKIKILPVPLQKDILTFYETLDK